ncbi:MAG: ATP-binding protein [Eubacteriales bacterium]|nr:ATP-binding protein [Eubacteriales bacterium]MDD3538217.1 ATP-binding protein [Eubacteriales bacterium]MDD4286216.1 ATP-binding protein [Eubacteriales bacterium]HPF19333.1 ATP-binding protein [Bacillota bacterium]HRV32714.1 ATP-binding protein [Anaerovoracaceae bacterium]
MKIAVLSGKGGTGKTFVSVNLAAAASSSLYIDCDVEEPNGRLFFRPEHRNEETISVLLPVFDGALCDGCRKCVDFCKFNALVYIKEKPMVFPGICHSCGGCALVCPRGAVSETPRPIGVVEAGTSGNTAVVTGVLEPGEISGVPLIRAALAKASESDRPVVIDCPPGSGCAVLESVSEADYCVLVAEPTAFGLHNFAMVLELVNLLGKPCGVVINKTEGPYRELEEYCAEHHVNILCRIPYSTELATLGAKALIAVRENEEMAAVFRRLSDKIEKEVRR